MTLHWASRHIHFSGRFSHEFLSKQGKQWQRSANLEGEKREKVERSMRDLEKEQVLKAEEVTGLQSKLAEAEKQGKQW